MAITHPSHLHESTIGWPRWWLSNRWYVGWLFSNSAVRGYIHMIRCLHVGKVMFQPEQEAEIELDDDDDDLPIWFAQSVQQLVTVNVSPLIFSDLFCYFDHFISTLPTPKWVHNIMFSCCTATRLAANPDNRLHACPIWVQSHWLRNNLAVGEDDLSPKASRFLSRKIQHFISEWSMSCQL